MKPNRKPRVRKFSSLMSEPLYRALQERAHQNGQPVRFVLENAVRHYLEVVLPYAMNVRPEVLRHMEQSFVDNQELMRRLAKAGK